MHDFIALQNHHSDSHARYVISLLKYAYVQERFIPPPPPKKKKKKKKNLGYGWEITYETHIGT